MTTVVDRWDVHPEHRWLRGERAERAIVFDESDGLWNVYGYAECREMLGDHRTFSSGTARLLPVSVEASLIEGDLSQMDPPQHRKFRKLLTPAFSPKLIAAMEPRITAITEGLLDGVEGKPEIELVADLAYPLPVIVIAELLGVPASDRDMFKGWADNVIESFSGFSSLDTEQGAEDIREGTERLQPLLEYLAGHIAERRRHPREDLMTQLATAEIDGERLTDNEAVNIANIMLITGHITTSMVLGNTVLCLDAYPEQAERVRADRALVPGAIEEALRLLPPSTVLTRATETEAEIGGQRIPKDQLIFLWLGAGNRDPREFTDPGRYDPARDPNPHFGFGWGIHFCIGAGLARLEGRIALNALLDRFPALRTDPASPPGFFDTPDMIGVNRLPLRTT
ncbi:cytochrome P450 [Actinomadura spongiicola]|uniref:Cytochrome P450 n=1 Tax=Actinomadura spongiicola TaxID=2303421 RepID=A0A372GGG5_9ACTN|nr:cytochrome P450 [Actinomadura spongiicola]RFS84173.1 cytochrome P450 [Actinomadura spongiicola]